ncbi:MAG: thioredoxin-like domain-containing protein [Dehalococcoidia bacterium]
MTARYAGKVRAPDFPPAGDWLNTPRPLSVRDFAGKLLVLDFWTYCCINCLHLVPVLRRLEGEYPDTLAVVGIHTPKFPHEQSASNVREALRRYGVAHPVLNDATGVVWQSYAVRAWPTLMFVDPVGKVIGKKEGELTYEDGKRLIDQMLEEFRGSGALRPSPPIEMTEQPPISMLRHPGKVLADVEGDRLFIADSGHNRILITDLDGTVQTMVGSGEEGAADGVLEGARFNQPQGMALSGELLYVADTGNHLIRTVDLEAGIVETIAGTGRKGVGWTEGGASLEVDLRSPWDLALVGRDLYIAMAGSHQIWMLNLDTRVAQAVVGIGEENIVDGPLHEALLAQPSGIVADQDGVLYFLDSETSSVRAADLVSTHRVSTLVGKGLFEFGDVDGAGEDARLQHPLGLDLSGAVLYVADTYNNKIKVLDTDTCTIHTLAGTGELGNADGGFGQASFYEPSGLSVVAGRIYVADTNNHRIRVIDLTERAVSTLEVDF